MSRKLQAPMPGAFHPDAPQPVAKIDPTLCEVCGAKKFPLFTTLVCPHKCEKARIADKCPECDNKGLTDVGARWQLEAPQKIIRRLCDKCHHIFDVDAATNLTIPE